MDLLKNTPDSFLSKNRKRRHPDSSLIAGSLKSLEILQLVENPNFEELARQHPSFLRAWKDTRQRQKFCNKSFSSCITQDFTVSLTRSLLQSQFGIQLPYLNLNHLCPPVPNRFFFIHWLSNCVLPSSTNGLLGMDIGTGATCIYPLLATRYLPNCNMVGIDVDAEALLLAKRNVTANQMESNIHLLQVPYSHSQDPSLPPGGPLQRGLNAYHQHLQFDFVMTNPPFYDPNTKEQIRVGDGRDRTAMTVCEGYYPGGEVGFVSEMFADSLMARRSSRWFSCMLGKKISLQFLQKLMIHVLGPVHVLATEYGPGQYTRWFLAWTFDQPAAFSDNASMQHHSFQVVIDKTNAVTEVVSRIQSFCQSSPGGWNLLLQSTLTSVGATVVIKEAMPLAISNFVDESIPHANIPQLILCALQGQDNSTFLPPEGHFVVQILLRSCPNNVVNVQLACYGHSTRGKKAIQKILNSMEGEVGRTNRKWRLIRQRGET